MHKLKVATFIYCDTCQCKLKREKTFKVNSEDKDAASDEAKPFIIKWLSSLKGSNCKVCQSIIDEVGVA